MVTRRTSSLLVLVLVSACSASPTEILVVTDTDLAVPSAADTFHLEVTGPDGRMMSSDADLTDGHLPRTTTLAHDTGPLGPFHVRVVARHAGADLVDRVATVSFVEGHVLVLRLDLLSACRGVSCAMGETCAAGGCRPVAVGAGELGMWTGMTPPHLDAGMMPDSPACVPTTEICNGVDDNCDGRIDETTDLASDPANCGGCGHVCAMVPHSTPTCAMGVCKVSCDAHYADCNSQYGDGCETSLQTVSDCGGCMLACLVSHATPSCSTGDCSLASCMSGWDSCDRMPPLPDVNGCETSVSSNPARCGSCSNACPSPAHSGPICTDGMCGIVCDSAWANCNVRVDDGCEASLADPGTCGDCVTNCHPPTPLCSGSPTRGFTCVGSCTLPEVLCGGSCVDTMQSAQNCGSCGTPCPTPAHGAPLCMASTCGVSCDTGYGNCDGMLSTGCEAPLVTLTNCGACGTPCAPANATGVCGAGTCAIGSCNTGWADCNSRADDGCEIHVATDVTHCGSCTTACPPSPANASPVCGASGCDIVCAPGFGNCDGDPTNGCERDLTTTTDCGSCGSGCAPSYLCQRDATSGVTSCVAACAGMVCGGTCTNVTSDPSNCMSCGNVCPSGAHAMAQCTMSTCSLLCDTGFGDCDTMASTGCETDLTATPTHCGNCATACPMRAHATTTCTSSTCGFTCMANYADCDTMASTGCEAMLGTTTNCTRCGDVCAVSGAHVIGGMCTSTGCALQCMGGYYDCDGSATNGCEVHAGGAGSRCAACATACAPATQVCCGTTCVTGTSCP